MGALAFGIAIVLSDETLDPVTLARLVEERGFESLFLPEHTHVPVRASIPYPLGGELPRAYRRTLDPFVALAAAAAATTTLRLGTGICLVVERDPIVTAKTVATLDRVSGGRVVLGVGAGWDLDELRNHGIRGRERFAVLEERVEAMRAIWVHDEASYDGTHVRFGPIWSWPKPVQRPHPPILIGGNGPSVLKRVLAYGDGWMPNARSDREELVSRVAELQRLAYEAGRAPVPVTLSGGPSDLATLERFVVAGATRCVWWLPTVGHDELERRLDAYARTAESYARG